MQELINENNQTHNEINHDQTQNRNSSFLFTLFAIALLMFSSCLNNCSVFDLNEHDLL